MQALRTPEGRFQNLPDYDFAPHYAQVEGPGECELRMHYVDEGPRDAAPILMLHGEPSWSYLYRHMIRHCVNAGHRVIAPDLIGFGKSDKPTRRSDYSYARHVAWVTRLVEQLDLREITLVCQDWGSLIGLRVATELEDRFGAVVISNGFLPTGEQGMSKAFKAWRLFSQWSPWFPISRVIQSACFKKLSPAELQAYEAPFPSRKYKAAAREFPALVPISADDPARQANLKAWKVLETWEKPFVCCFAGGDPITRGLDKHFKKRVPGAQGQKHTKLRGGHFIQEDAPTEFANVALELLGAG